MSERPTITVIITREDGGGVVLTIVGRHFHEAPQVVVHNRTDLKFTTQGQIWGDLPCAEKLN